MRKIFYFVSILLFVSVGGSLQNLWAQPTLDSFCAEKFAKTTQCPEKTCQLQKECTKEGEADTCKNVCLAKKCTEISIESCPQEFCAPMENCSGKKICHFKMTGGTPACGELAYAGQDVACCPGFVRRCGVEFLDGSCDMKGENSVYSIPICIPCGDGVCSQFEDRCNCPEDCKRGLQREEVPEKFKEILRKQQQLREQSQPPGPATPSQVIAPPPNQSKKNFTW